MKVRPAPIRIAAAAGLACSSLAFSQNTNEVEPNETKATATPVAAPMVAGHTLTGNTTGAVTTPGPTSVDTWRVKTATDAAAIYRYRLVLTSTTVGHSGMILSLSQVQAPPGTWPGATGTGAASEVATAQTSVASTTPPRFNQWYGFGKAEELYYRVFGMGGTTANYTATLERTTVTPVTVAGAFAPGPITISTWNQGHLTDTDFWVYDQDFNAIVGFGNDDEAAAAISGVPGTMGSTVQSALKRTYPAGTYYIAMSNFQSCNSLGSPCDDDYRQGPMMDFPNVYVNSSNTINLNMQFSVTDGVTTTVVPNTKTGPFDVNWFKFVVGGKPPPTCYPDCDHVGGLTGNDFQCFLNAFVAGLSYANCDGVGGLTGNDFQCFLDKYVAGCT